MPFTNSYAYDILYDCTPKGVRIYDFNEYGYGTWFDSEGTGYMVKLFSLRDPNIGSGIGSSAPNSSGLGSANPTERSLNTTEKNSTNVTLMEQNNFTPIEIKSNDEATSKFKKLFVKIKNSKSLLKLD